VLAWLGRGFRWIEGCLRVLPIYWRIFAIAAVNTAVVVILAALIWDGAKILSSAWEQVRQVRQSDDLLNLMEGEAGRLQNLVHRYINQPSPDIFAEILLLREAVLGTLRTRGRADPLLSPSVEDLAQVTERFFDGFGDLRAEQGKITTTYDSTVLKPAREMAGLYTTIEGTTERRDSPIGILQSKSHENFTAALVAANAYYLSPDRAQADDVTRNLTAVEQAIPAMIGLATNDTQRVALQSLAERTAVFRRGIGELRDLFANREILLRTAIDGNQAIMVSTIDNLTADMHQHEMRAQEQFDTALAEIYRKVVIVAILFTSLIGIMGVFIARSISNPLRGLMREMRAIVAGRYEHEIEGTAASDEIGDMARNLEVFRENAVARRVAETELRRAKEHAETALSDLQRAQRNLIEAEKLAALGGLVAGVAHEVNNPVGISLTVASSFARRVEEFSSEVQAGTLRRSRLDDFISGSRDAAQQLVGNLQRAGELIQSFKQVAVDRSHEERRQFDLREATDQIIISLRPALRKVPVELSIAGPEGLLMDSYPGSYGQVLTNLFLNAIVHGFPDGRSGRVIIDMRPIGSREVEVILADDGVGMTEEVQRRAFDPFFTTRRNQGGTGLGLHIVYNIVTQRLGGRLSCDSQVGRGTVFTLLLPRTAPRPSFELTEDGERDVS